MKRPDQTAAVHGGEDHNYAHGSVTVPIFNTATYRFESSQQLQEHLSGKVPGYHYSRYGNPTVEAVERKLAGIESSEDAVLFSSGMAALSTLMLSVLKSGQHVLLTSDIYRPTAELITQLLSKFGVTYSRVSLDDPEAMRAAIQPKVTRIIFTELPTNPHTRVADMKLLKELKKLAKGARIVVDATFASPYNMRPLDQGADIVAHSVTKFLAGHNDVTAGVICCRAAMADAFREQRALLGGTIDANSAYLVMRGLKTFPLRMQRHNDNALQIARWLEAHPKIEKVFYPGLASHPDHELATRQMFGFGGVVSFCVRGDGATTANFLDRLNTIQHSGSLGGPESLAHQPARFSYFDMPPEGREAHGIEENLVRLSVGLEEASDLIADLENALNEMDV